MLSLRRLLIAGVAASALVVILAAVAIAHAEFGSSVPSPKSVVSSVPAVVKVVYTEGVNPKGSSITVVGPNGSRVDTGDGHVDLNDPDRKTMLVSVKSGSGPGTYTVNWTTVSADDGDSASGSFTFQVATTATGLPRTGGIPIAPVVLAGLGILGAGVVLRRRG